MERDDYLAIVKERLHEKRYIHTIGVMETAIRLAKKYGVDQKKAETAAILHDIAKCEDVEKMEQITKNYLDDQLLGWGGEILHGPVGAWIVKTEFQIYDEDILNAIRYHTTGRPKMSDLEKIIYISDMIEPNRNFDGVEKLRKKAEQSLNIGMRACIHHSISFLVHSKQQIYPLSILCYNDLYREEQ